jgi:hypothetical protein
MQRRTLLKLSALAASGLALPADLLQARVAEAAGRGFVLNRQQRKLVTTIADTIIPATDTPGATDVGVVDFVDLMVAEWLSPDERARFLQGLGNFEPAVVKALGRPFGRLTGKERLAWLQSLQASAWAAPLGAGGHAPFIVWIKRLTVFGYYTSQAGASTELTLNLVPGAYRPCEAVLPGQRAFSLDRHSPIFVVDNTPYNVE